MDQKSRLFIYDRREMGVLILLGVMVAVFAFTLGVHLGKKVSPRLLVQTQTTQTAQTTPDKVPDRGEITEASRGSQQTADDALTENLHNEVARTGIKLDKARQVELPGGTRSKNGGATTLKPRNPTIDTASKAKEIEKTPAIRENSGEESDVHPVGKFTLQVGSHQAIGEAKHQIVELESKGLKPFLKPAEIHGKGKWYRVYVGGYSSKHAAEQAGENYRGKHLIDSFVVAKTAEK